MSHKSLLLPLVFSCFFFNYLFAYSDSGISAKLDKGKKIEPGFIEAQYPEGEQAFYNFLADNIRYPYILVNIEMEGDVDVKFTIDKEGSAQDIEITRGFDPLADDEVIRVLKTMPKWKPATIDGVNENDNLKLTIMFSLTDELRQKSSEMKKQDAGSDAYIELKEKVHEILPDQPKEEKVSDTNTPSADPLLNRVPEFPGGQEALEAYLKSNMKYPKRAIQLGIEGRAVFNLQISEEGEITKIWIFKGLYPDCDEEAYYLIKKMPKWIPGLKDGKPASMKVMLPIPFTLPK